MTRVQMPEWSSSVRAYETPSTVEKASNCGRASEPSILQDPKTRCPTRAEMRATVCRAHGASELPGIICRSYLPQASDRASTDPIPQIEPTKVKLPDVSRTFGLNLNHNGCGGGGNEPRARP